MWTEIITVVLLILVIWFLFLKWRLDRERRRVIRRYEEFSDEDKRKHGINPDFKGRIQKVGEREGLYPESISNFERSRELKRSELLPDATPIGDEKSDRSTRKNSQSD